MRECTVTIPNQLGLHARAAAQFVTVASRFRAAVYLIKNGTSVDGKSITSLMMLEVSQGDEVVIRVEGTDEEEALHTLMTLVDGGFGEPDRVP